MRRKTVLSLAVLAALAAPPELRAHDTESDPDTAAIVVPNWRDNWVPFFDGGDPKTRHDSDTTNDQSRENSDTRHSMQRWRDETTTTGEVGEVGDGCNYGSCLAVSDQDGDLLRADVTGSVFSEGSPIPPFNGGTKPGDPNEANVEVAGAGVQANFGGAQDLTSGTGGPPTLSAPENLSDPEVTPDTEPDQANPPDQISAAYSADHSLGGWAHSPGQHGGPGNEDGGEDLDPEFQQHDTHGGTMSVDVYLPTADDPTRVRDSKYGLVIHDHLDCWPPGCLDEYHNVYPADPERTVYQAGEMPDQAESVARDPSTWLYGSPGHQDPDFPAPPLTETTQPATDVVFDDVVNPNVDPAVSSATGVGEANSACCKPVTEDGPFCNRNPGGNVVGIAEREALAGCVELPNGDCFGGAASGAPPDTTADGCMVIGGQPMTLEGEELTPEECTARAVAACCAADACL